MLYKILADTLVAMHFSWILFMLLGSILTLCGFFSTYLLRTSADRWREFFDKWLFRLLHLLGIAFVSLLAIRGKYCPLTIWENSLRARYDPASTYSGSCIVHYVEKLLHLEVNIAILMRFTIFIALFTVAVFIIRPPKKIKRIFK